MGSQTTVPCARAKDSGLLDPFQSPIWVKVCLVLFRPLSLLQACPVTDLHAFLLTLVKQLYDRCKTSSLVIPAGDSWFLHCHAIVNLVGR